MDAGGEVLDASRQSAQDFWDLRRSFCCRPACSRDAACRRPRIAYMCALGDLREKEGFGASRRGSGCRDPPARRPATTARLVIEMMRHGRRSGDHRAATRRRGDGGPAARAQHRPTRPKAPSLPRAACSPPSATSCARRSTPSSASRTCCCTGYSAASPIRGRRNM